MRLFHVGICLALMCCADVPCSAQYFPPRGQWETRTPQELDVDPARLETAIQFAQANEYSGPRDLRVAILEGFRSEPFHEILGPTKKRGGPAGVVIKDGFIVGQWGDVQRVDMTFSVTKSYLSTVAGLALDQGLIRDVHDPVSSYVWDGTFSGEHNSKITWHTLLNQSSDWSGSLFGLHDWADRPPQDGGLDEWRYRELKTPGTHFQYNDVRVNVLAYSLLQVFRKPLPQVLKENVMDRIGASTTWRWYGYEDAWVVVDGLRMKSVTGGGHSGGGLFISTLDHARFGWLFANQGEWQGQQVLSPEWIESVQQPSEANEAYGYMWWLNRGDRQWEGVEDNSIYFAAGFGGNYVIVDKSQKLVVVTRWLNPPALAGFMSRLMSAVD